MNLTLKVESVDAAAVTDTYEDGAFQAFDSIAVLVTAGERSGQRWRILVESESDLARRWSRPGQTLEVSVEPRWLESPVLFAGAFTLQSDGEPA